MPIQQPPEVLALVIADHVHQDDLTGKFFILGTRSLIEAPTFPWDQPSLAVYSVLTDGRGKTTIKLRVVDADEALDPLLKFETDLDFLDPTEDREVVFLLTQMVFPEPGTYRFQLYGAGQFLRERSLILSELPSEADE